MKIALIIVGVVGILIGLAIAGVSLGLHLANPRRISFDEAFPGMLGGCCCSGLALPISIGGVAWMLIGKKEDARKSPKADESE